MGINPKPIGMNGLYADPFQPLDDLEWVAKHLRAFLDDYTTDNRGDIGSLIRSEAINGVDSILDLKINTGISAPYLNSLMASVARLAAEKLDKIRFKAWRCLQKFWESSPDLPPLEMYVHCLFFLT